MRIRVCLLFLAPFGAVAATEPVDHPCAAIREPTERLACFDAAFRAPAGVARESPRARQTSPIENFTARVTELSQRRDGRLVVTLDNGQEWAQSEFDSQAMVAVGDTVTIRRGVLGSYLLVTRAGIGTRVKRSR